MPRSSNVPAAWFWNTWSARPAEMVFLPLGVRITPVAYADSIRRATLFDGGDGVRLGRHAIDAGVVELELEHAGTALDWRVDKSDPFAWHGAWRALARGEWGLRFWVNLCLSADGGEAARFDPGVVAGAGAAVLKVGHRFVALASREAPAQVTSHASVEALAADYEQRGYFHLGSRGAHGPVVALRFNLEMAPGNRFAAAVADRADLAIARARALLDRPPEPADLPGQTGPSAGALDAVRDVMGWNTVWDGVNARCYTAISRTWNQRKFGGFGVWLNDQLYAALMSGVLDAELGRANLAVALAQATPAGNLACLVTANDAWVDRSQIPIGAFVTWLLFLRGRSRALLQGAYDTLARNHAWWWRCRDPAGTGLASYGSSDVGEGLYRGTHFGARNESSMDNSPIHDEAEYDPVTRTLTTVDVGLNSLLALDAEMLGLMAAELGRVGEAAAHRERARATGEAVRDRLWDAGRGLFANRLRRGDFVRSVGPTSFYPLICGAVTPAQVESLVTHLRDPATFGGPFPIPGTSRDDPAARDNSYWRGRVWPPLNFWVWQGLRRQGPRADASQLAAAGLDLFRRAWNTHRLCPENYNAETGEALDQPDTDGFYGWGALMPLMAVSETMDFNPWSGWEVTNGGADLRIGPMQSPAGLVRLTIAAGVARLEHGERVLLETDILGTLDHIVLDDNLISLRLPASLVAGSSLRFPSLEGAVLARIGERDVVAKTSDGGPIIRPDTTDGGQTITLARHPPR